MTYNRATKAGGKRAFSLYDCLTRPTCDSGWGDRIPTVYGNLYFRDNGASVLGVAHLDSVLRARPEKKGPFVYAPQLDDRLGVWVLLDLLPRLGVKVDVLLTDCEEIGQSTASFFQPSRDYNWMFQFDRHGSDVVMYQYAHADYFDLLQAYGFRPGSGSYSDIVDLDYLGVAGFNFGAGYHEEHSRWCWADLRKARRAAKRFCRLYADLKREVLPVISANRDDLWGDLWRDDWRGNELGRREYELVAEIARNFGYLDVNEFIRDGGLQFCY